MNKNKIQRTHSEPTKEQENTGGDIGQINFLPSYSKGYRSFLDGFNRNITGNIQYSDYNTEFINDYFPPDIIDSLTINEGKYDIIGIFNGECLVYNKQDKKVESHNCEMSGDKEKKLQTASPPVKQISANLESEQQQILKQETMNQQDKSVEQEDDSPTNVVNDSTVDRIGDVEKRLMIDAAPKPPIPMLTPPQNLIQNNRIPFNMPTEPISLPKIGKKQPLLIKDSPLASQQQEFTSENDIGPLESPQTNMNTGSQESMDTSSQNVDFMKTYTTDNINSKIDKDILKLGNNDIKTPGCRANNFITSGLCEYGEDNKSKLGRKNGLFFHPDKNEKCPEYGKQRLEMLHTFCDGKEIPDEYKNTDDYKNKYNAAKTMVEEKAVQDAKLASPGKNTVFNFSRGILSNSAINQVTKPSRRQDGLPTPPAQSTKLAEAVRLAEAEKLEKEAAAELAKQKAAEKTAELAAAQEQAAKQKEAQEQAAKEQEEKAAKLEKEKAAKQGVQAAQARLAAKEAAKEAAQAAQAAQARLAAKEAAKQAAQAAQARLAARLAAKQAAQAAQARLAAKQAAQARLAAEEDRKAEKAAKEAANVAKQKEDRKAEKAAKAKAAKKIQSMTRGRLSRQKALHANPEPELESVSEQEGFNTNQSSSTSITKQLHSNPWNPNTNPTIHLGGKKANKSKKKQQNKQGQGRKTRKKRS